MLVLQNISQHDAAAYLIKIVITLTIDTLAKFSLLLLLQSVLTCISTYMPTWIITYIVTWRTCFVTGKAATTCNNYNMRESVLP